jgi:hypothetical protein
MFAAAEAAFATANAKSDTYQIKINDTLSVSAPGVLKNDTDVSSATLLLSTQHGHLDFNTNGSFIYEPFEDFTGRDTFTYRVTDGITTAQAIVYLEVYATARGSLSGPGTICQGDGGAIVVDLVGEPPFRVEWTDGVVQNSSSKRFSRIVQPEKAGQFSVQRMEDKNGPGPMAPASVFVSLASRPAPPVISSVGTSEIGDPFTMIASTVSTSYQWYRNGIAIAGATSRTYGFSPAQASNSASYTVTGRVSQCHSYPSPAFPVTIATKRVIPVIGQTTGAYDSVFATSVQIHNRSTSPINGSLDFYGNQPSAPRVTPFTAGPRATVAYTDIAPILGSSTIGSVDIGAPGGPRVPDSVVRVYHDAGPRGTMGVTVPQIRYGDVLHAGEVAVLIGPADPLRTRFNIGIRTLDAGATFNIRSYGADGKLRMLVQRAFGANSFHQPLATDILGIPITGGESMHFEMVSGSAVIYGSAVDNSTNDSSLQIAEKIEAQPQTLDLVIPVVASNYGGFGSWFKTGLQIHNPGAFPTTVKLGFRPALQIAGSATNLRLYQVPAYGTLQIDDILPALGTKGIGSIDVLSTGKTRPILLPHVFNDGLEGRTGSTELVLARDEFPQGGDTIVLIAPPTPATLRFNIGLRTLAEGAAIEWTVRNAQGVTRSTAYREFPTEYFVQQPAADFFGFPLDANDSVEFRVIRGAIVVYGATTDNISQDPNIQMAKR